MKLFETALENMAALTMHLPLLVSESGRWFDASLTIETVEKEESRMTIDVNLISAAIFAWIAVVNLRYGKQEGQEKSLLLGSSAAGFRESPGVPLSQWSKYGVMGLMRTLRKQLY